MPRITGKIKVQSEAAQLYFIRVNAFVRPITPLKLEVTVRTRSYG
ncbi:MAG: hypothetical protein HLUCCA13_08235 [Halomonas sp. HL-48]|nr:MAG: hypothetical protein HLUCCA13_08235 [Halomonas sp. HL-48]